MFANPTYKRVFAVTLVTILVSAMFPLFTFAGTLLDTIGTITQIGPGDFSVNVSGSEQAFFITRKTFLSSYDITIGDKVQVLFMAEQPDTAIEVNRLALSSTPQRPQAPEHTHYSVTGVITDAGMNTVTIYKNGKYRTFSKEDISNIIGATDGILLGDTIEIIYAKENPQIAIQITMVTQGDNHKKPAAEHTHYAVTGVVTNAGMSTITVYYNGKYRTFGKEEASLVGCTDGILLGDTVRVTFVKDNPQDAIEIRMVKQGDNHDN